MPWGECEAGSCDRVDELTRGWCGGHYARWYKDGDARGDIPIGEAVNNTVGRTCAVDICERPVQYRDWCTAHYQRWSKYGAAAVSQCRHCGETFHDPEIRSGYRTCTTCKECYVDGCHRPIVSDRICGTHYKRLKKWGHVGEDIPVDSHLNNLVCEIDECEAPTLGGALGWCKRHYGISHNYDLHPDDYERMRREQSHRCRICGVSESEIDVLNVDHDHDSGRVRGLLCPNCNLGIGLFTDNPDLLVSAAEYLRGS